MSPYEFCEQKAIASGSSFYYSFRFLSEQHRQALTVVYAFCRQLDDIVDNTTDSQLAAIKINWWRQEVLNIDLRPQHPISIALSECRKINSIPKQYLLELIDGMAMDLHKNRFATLAELESYCYHAASTVGLLTVNILGFDDQRSLLFAKHMGIALQLINIIRDVGEDARLNRIYLPQDLLSRFKVSPEQIIANKPSLELNHLMKHMANIARGYHQIALSELPQVDRGKQRVSLIMASIYLRLLDEIEHNQFNVLTHKTSLTPLCKLWTAWLSYRHEKRITKSSRKQAA